jgi:small subunit ribosomal protein S9
MAKPKKINYTYAVGKRKSAIARVRLFHGKGESTVNGMAIAKFLPGKVAEEKYMRPFRILDVAEKYYVTVRVVGGGKNGQLEATIAGIAKTLAKVKKDEFRPALKKAGLLTRDSRIRQRRMVGTGGKARRKKQSPKR